jgi:Mor transcription activator family protein
MSITHQTQGRDGIAHYGGVLTDVDGLAAREVNLIILTTDTPAVIQSREADTINTLFITNFSSNGLSALETYLELGGLHHAIQLFLFLIHYDQDFTPRTTTRQRDEQIRQRHMNGETLSDLAREYGISPQRIFQIINPNPPNRQTSKEEKLS